MDDAHKTYAEQRKRDDDEYGAKKARETRELALSEAIRSSGEGAPRDIVVATAKAFENYLNNVQEDLKLTAAKAEYDYQKAAAQYKATYDPSLAKIELRPNPPSEPSRAE